MKGEEKMQKKTMISISERENVVSLRTYSRDHQCSNNFFLLKKEIQQLMSERMIIVKDVCSFAELRTQKNHPETLTGRQDGGMIIHMHA